MVEDDHRTILPARVLEPLSGRHAATLTDRAPTDNEVPRPPGSVPRVRLWRILGRLVKAALAVLIIVSGLVATQGHPWATLAVVGGLLAIGVVLWWRRQRDIATSVAALALGCVLTGYLTAWGAGVAGRDVGPQTGVAFWIFGGVVTIAAWTTRRHPGSRGATVAFANAALVAASLLTALSPGSGAIVGLLAGMSVVAWRSGGWLAIQRSWWRRRPLPATPRAGSPSATTEGIRDAPRTAEVVRDIDRWHSLGSRRAGRTAQTIDHVLVGPERIVLLHTKAWAGRIAKEYDEAAGETYTFDGDPAQLAERLRTVVRANTEAQLRLDEDHRSLWSVVTLWDSTRLPERAVELDVLADTRSSETARVILVRGERLRAWLDANGTPLSPEDIDRRLRVVARMLPAAD